MLSLSSSSDLPDEDCDCKPSSPLLLPAFKCVHTGKDGYDCWTCNCFFCGDLAILMQETHLPLCKCSTKTRTPPPRHYHHILCFTPPLTTVIGLKKYKQTKVFFPTYSRIMMGAAELSTRTWSSQLGGSGGSL